MSIPNAVYNVVTEERAKSRKVHGFNTPEQKSSSEEEV